MAADTYDPILGLILQGTGNNNNSWGVNLNNSMITLASRAIAGMAVRPTTGGSIDLSGSPPPAGARQDLDLGQYISGVLVSNVTITVPNLTKSWLFVNATTGAFQVLVKTAAGTARNVPQGTVKLLYCDGTNVGRFDADEVGTLRHSPCASIGAGAVLCDGTSYLRADYPDLFAKIGTTHGAADGTHFSVPNYTTSNRFLRAAGGSLGVTSASFQASQNLTHTHTVSGAPSLGTLTADAAGSHQHYAPMGDPTHGHTASTSAVNLGGSNGINYYGGPFNVVAASVTVNGAGTGVYVYNNAGTAHFTHTDGSHGHTVSGAPGLGTLGTVASGGSEVRPESAAVWIGIKI